MSALPASFRSLCFAALCTCAWVAHAEEVHTEETHVEDARSGDVRKREWVLEADPYYSDVGYQVPLTNKPIPTITSNSEAVIYRDLIEGSLIPRYMLLEASVYPLPALGTYIRSHSPSTYRQAEIGHSGINLLESATIGFQEPWAVSAFFGNVAKLKRPGDTREGANYGYTGYLLSAGTKHIKNNTLIADDWYELEWKIKGKLDYAEEKLSWSFRVGGRFNSNKNINDVTYVNLHRSNLDFRYSFLEWLENTNYDLRVHFLQNGGKVVRWELVAGKKLPNVDWGFIPTLDLGLVWSSPDEYAGILKGTQGNTTTLVLRPSFEF